jgi:hypothetical protein
MIKRRLDVLKIIVSYWGYLVHKELTNIESDDAPHKSPKETEVAIEVFAKSTNFNPADDATVRVHI